MTTNTRLMLVLLERTESDGASSDVIDTTGEPIRARPIRHVRPEPVAAFEPGTALAKLEGWLGRVS
jgi:hypothetical protein